MNLKSGFFIVLLICVLFTLVSVSAAEDNQTVPADNTQFKELNQSITLAKGEVNLTHDYKYDYGDIFITKNESFVINGNNHTIEGINNNSIFDVISNGEVIFNDLTFKNCRNFSIRFSTPGILNNVKFINCTDTPDTYLISVRKNATINNCNFDLSNTNTKYVIFVEESLTVKNSLFTGGDSNNGVVYSMGSLFVENTVFENITSKISTAINFKGYKLEIRKSKFKNLHAQLSGGAILAKYFVYDDKIESGISLNNFIIDECEFDNLTSANDGGALYFDLDSAADYNYKIFFIANSNFTDCYSSFGGAIAIQGGCLNIGGCTFFNNTADFEGGAIFSTWSDVEIEQSSFIENAAFKNAGALYFDKGKLTINESYFLNNTIVKQGLDVANCIYAHDVDADFMNSVFDNGGISVYADFASNSKLENITKNDDIFLMDNKNYIVSIESKGIRLNLTKNEINVDKLPSYFDLRDWGWVSPVKKQGDNDDCWAFATAASLESSLLRATGKLYNLSENYVQGLQLKYAKNGDLRISFTGFAYSGLGYALSWYGVLPSDGAYDDRGLIRDTDFSDERIHLQDAMIIFGKKNDTVDLIKQAILKYGAVTIQMTHAEPGIGVNTTGEQIAVMDHMIHFVSIIGWNDTIYEEQGGAWICKDSLNGISPQPLNSEDILGVDYYAIVPQNPAICYIFENDIDYHVNYQTDLTALTGFDGNYTYYSNEFISKYDELIGAVGTYFNQSGIDYSFDVYVNGIKVHTQKGVSEFAGFRTIVLNKYIPIKKNDEFKVVFKSNALPYQAFSRQHYIPNMTFVSSDGKTWSDFTLLNKTVCLKVYTVADDTKMIGNRNIAVDYLGGSYFSVKVVTANGKAVGAGEIVKFKIAGKTYLVKTDNNGIAKIKISNVPKKYTITTTYNGKTVKNTVSVRHVITANKLTVKKTAKSFKLKAKVKINKKLIKGKTVVFKFKGKTYKVKTNKQGIAQLVINKKIINKLKKGKTYIAYASYKKDTIKTTVKIK